MRMTLDVFTALALFAFVSSITPGPNNLMLMASGANFGFQRTLPHMLGVGIGFTLMIMLVGVGVIQLFDAVPASYEILKVVSIVYLTYLAWKIATATAPEEVDGQHRPMTFLQAALFQWVNPKAWTMALTAISVYAPSRSTEAIVLSALVFGLINLPSVSVWTVMGQQLRRALRSQRQLQCFNLIMAALLMLSLYPVLVTG